MKSKILTLFLFANLFAFETALGHSGSSDSLSTKSDGQADYWRQREELLNDREKIMEEEYKNSLACLSKEISNSTNWMRAITGLFTAISLIFSFYAIIIQRQQKKLDEQQSKLDKKQDEIDKTFQRILTTEDWAVTIRKRTRLLVIYPDTEEIEFPKELEFVFKNENRIFKYTDIVKIKPSDFNLTNIQTNGYDAVIILDLINGISYFEEKSIQDFILKLPPAIAVILCGSGDFNNLNRPLISGARMAPQIYQNLMNLLKFQSLSRGEFSPA